MSYADEIIDRLAERAETRIASEAVQTKAREQFDLRVTWPLWGVCVVTMTWWLGGRGFAVAISAFVGYLLWRAHMEDRRPGADAATIDTEAEHYVRHAIIADMSSRAVQVWRTEGGKILTTDDPAWDDFWPRVEIVVGEFERLSPRKRRMRLAEAKRASLSACEEMMHLAKEYQVEPLWWAVPDRAT